MLKPGMNELKIAHEFTFPGDVVGTNGMQNGRTVRWENTIADLIQNVDLVAKVNPNTETNEQKKTCGLFGLELPLIFVSTLVFLHLRTRRKNRHYLP